MHRYTLNCNENYNEFVHRAYFGDYLHANPALRGSTNPVFPLASIPVVLTFQYRACQDAMFDILDGQTIVVHFSFCVQGHNVLP